MIDRVKERYGYDIEQFHPQAAERRGSSARSRSERVLAKASTCARAAAASARSDQLNRALSDVSGWVTWASAANSRYAHAELHEEEHDAPRAHREVQSARGLDRSRRMGLPRKRSTCRSIRCMRAVIRALRLRAVHALYGPGEDSRAGRWWWESRDTKECGLHMHDHTDCDRSQREHPASASLI